MSTPIESAQSIVNKAITELHSALPGPLARYLAEVLEWNTVLSLVSRKDPVAACERLLFESIELGQRLEVDRVGRLADVGSGAGFPGLVWALMYPTVEVVLIERREKRALFLDRTSRMLAAGNVTVLTAELGEISREIGSHERFDLVTAVAVGEPATIADHAEALLNSSGRFASTISRKRNAPAHLGPTLRLLERVEGKFGCYAIYGRGV